MNRCRLCNGENFKIIHRGTRDNPDIDVLKCDACGLVFLSQNIADNRFYMDSQMHSGIDFDTWRNNTFADDKRRFLKYKDLINGKQILDFGCGNGGFLKLIKEQGSGRYAAGLDLDVAAMEHLSKEGIECYKTLQELPDVKFDLIFMFHVFEHLSEPEAVLQTLFGHVSPEGLVVIETPNADDALLSIYHCERFADFTYWSPHICLYNESTLARTIEKQETGLEIIEMHQEQRYPLANHLRWLAKGLPGGGVKEFAVLNENNLNDAYAAVLRSLKACDTLTCMVKRK